jgi:DNA-binding NarL/FixJ family response regulator
MPEIRVLLVDDHRILREGLRSLLERQPDIKVVGEAGDGLEALRKVALLQPDVVVMDIAMPGMDGLEATARIKKEHPQVRVLALTQYDEEQFIVPLLRAGASGYVLKRAGRKEVLQAIRQVAEEGAFLPPQAARQILKAMQEPQEEPEPRLTPREAEVLRLVAQGKTNREIAALLGISPKTVSVHRSNLMAKLGLHSSTDLVRYAIRKGLVAP